MKKIVYIIPGFKHSPLKKAYQDIARLFEERNFEVVLVKIDWKYKTINDWETQFLKDNYKEENPENYIFGFSYGAVISFLISTQKNINTQILCSLSPYFKEDLSSVPKSWKKQIGRRRVESFENIEMSSIAPKIKSKTYLLFGTKEHKSVQSRANDTFKRLQTEKYLIPVKGSKHDIANPEYLKEIGKVINQLV